MKNNHISAFPLLIKTALADVQFKVMQGIWQQSPEYWGKDKSELDSVLYPSEKWGTTDQHRFDRNHPYLQACDVARELCVELGRYCLAHGLNPSASPLVENLHFKDFFFEAFEKGRVVNCKELTPSIIHSSVEKQNVLQWESWIITTGSEDFSTDDYGQDQYIRPLVARHCSGKNEVILWMPGHAKDRARVAYELITGSAFSGVDNLGDDEPHRFEKLCWGSDGDHFDDDQFDDDSMELDEGYELNIDELLDLMAMNAKEEIEELCNAALQRIADDTHN